MNLFISKPDIPKPPRVTPDARKQLSGLIAEKGLPAAFHEGAQIIRAKYAEFGRYVVELGTDMNRLSVEGEWPLPIVKLGAALAMYAYNNSGYTQTVDEKALATGRLLVDLGGVPDTFLDSLAADSGLADLSAELVEIQQLVDDEHGLTQVIDIGAGCTRHYLQQAILAA